MQATSAESLQQVAGLFNLNVNDVLADNQGVISGPNDSLEGRSILLCSRNGELLGIQRPAQPISWACPPAAAATSSRHQ